MAQTSANIEAIIAGPIIELQTGIIELQMGLQIYLLETIEAMVKENAPKDVIDEGRSILCFLYEVHDKTRPLTTSLLNWTRRCCS